MIPAVHTHSCPRSHRPPGGLDWQTEAYPRAPSDVAGLAKALVVHARHSLARTKAHSDQLQQIRDQRLPCQSARRWRSSRPQTQSGFSPGHRLDFGASTLR